MKIHTIDLSALTATEIAQFNDNPNVTTQGDTDVVLYLRYSSDRQTDQSIEGQLRDCISYCKQNAYRIYDVYVDRAASAKTAEQRTEFLRMIADSERRRWKYVIVWKLDRFARNRNDSAIYKMRLKKNGVKVLSVTEKISDNPEGIILESVLEGMAEFYSAELSQKIKRGRRESALKCLSLGGRYPLGYTVKDKQIVIDPVTAPIVQKAFELYASGWSIADICREFNTRGYRTVTGSEFNANSFKTMLRSKKYIGVYTYKDMEIEDGMPRIISDELFNKVQHLLNQRAEAPGRGKAKVEYLLSGKLFCGHCGQPMNGDCGKSRNGMRYHYYTCYGKKKHRSCSKKNLPKDWIEQVVAEDAFSILTPENIEQIAQIAVNQSEEDILNNTRIPALQEKRDSTHKSIKNIVVAIEKGVASDTLMARLTELEQEEKFLSREIEEEEKGVIRLTVPMVIFWLEQFLNGDIEDEKFKRQLIDLLVNRVEVYDLPDGDKYKVTIYFNLTSHAPKSISVSMGSDVSGYAPPNDANPNFLVVGTVLVQTKIHSLP